MMLRTPEATLFPYTTLFRSTTACRVSPFFSSRARSSPSVFQLMSDRCTRDRKSTRLNSSHVRISYDVFCLKKKIVVEKSHVTWLGKLAIAIASHDGPSDLLP